MNKNEVLSELQGMISRDILQGQDKGLNAETPLLEWGVLDSLSMVTLINFIEERWGVAISDSERSPENFVNLNAISELVLRAPSR